MPGQDCDGSGTNCLADLRCDVEQLHAAGVGRREQGPRGRHRIERGRAELGRRAAVVGPVLPAAPVDTTAPGIGGTAQQGNTLTVSNGVWSNNPTAFTYVWQNCNSSGTTCSAIAGATSSTYTLRASDVGKNVSVTVTASNSGGRTSVTTASVGPVLPPAPANTQLPVITGTGRAGEHAEREQRDVEQQPNRLQLRVGELQQLRRKLRRDRWRDIE